MTPPRPLLLLGAGGLTRETLELVAAVNAADGQAPAWRVLGILDDDAATHGTVVGGVPVLGPTAAVHDHPGALVAACVASPHRPLGRLQLTARLDLPAERWATLVHPTAVVPGSATIGHGSILHATTVLTADVTLGAHVVAMPAVVLTHDDVVGDGATFGAGVRLAGGVRVEEAAYLGAGALVREHVVVGRGAVVGMGAVVTTPVPAGEVWVGVPARPLGAVAVAGVEGTARTPR